MYDRDTENTMQSSLNALYCHMPKRDDLDVQTYRVEKAVTIAIDRKSQFERQRRLNLRLMLVVMAEALTIAYLVWGRW